VKNGTGTADAATGKTTGTTIPSVDHVAAIAVVFGWPPFLAFWLFYYASGFRFSKNIALVVFSLVVALIVETILWVPWSMKRA
jgi:hypothetical protein